MKISRLKRIDDKVVVKINQNADAKIITEAMELVEEAKKKNRKHRN